jgi:hypothetical protein
MKWIKLFEKFDIRENTKDDIYGIFVELRDIGYDIEVHITKCKSGDQITVMIYKSDELDEKFDDLEEIVECLKMFEDYLKIYLKEYDINYYGDYRSTPTDILKQRYIGKTHHSILNNSGSFYGNESLRGIKILIEE